MKKVIFICMMIFGSSVHAFETNTEKVKQFQEQVTQLENIINGAPALLIERKKELIELKDLSIKVKQAVTDMMDTKNLCAKSDFPQTKVLCNQYKNLDVNEFLFTKRQEVLEAMKKASRAVAETEELQKQLPIYNKMLKSLQESIDLYNRPVKH